MSSVFKNKDNRNERPRKYITKTRQAEFPPQNRFWPWSIRTGQFARTQFRRQKHRAKPPCRIAQHSTKSQTRSLPFHGGRPIAVRNLRLQTSPVQHVWPKSAR